MNTDGNTYAINQHLYAMDTVDYAQEVIDQMTDKELMDYAQDWDIYIRDPQGDFLDEGLEALYDKIDENIKWRSHDCFDDFMWVFA